METESPTLLTATKREVRGHLRRLLLQTALFLEVVDELLARAGTLNQVVHPEYKLPETEEVGIGDLFLEQCQRIWEEAVIGITRMGELIEFAWEDTHFVYPRARRDGPLVHELHEMLKGQIFLNKYVVKLLKDAGQPTDDAVAMELANLSLRLANQAAELEVQLVESEGPGFQLEFDDAPFVDGSISYSKSEADSE